MSKRLCLRFLARMCLLTCVLACPSPFVLAQNAPELPKGAWSLVSLDDKPLELTEQEQRNRPFVEFVQNPDRVFGLSGCNRFHGGYKADATSLTFKEMATTMMACPPNLMELEQRFLGMLGNVRHATLQQDTFIFSDEHGRTLAVFARKQ